MKLNFKFITFKIFLSRSSLWFEHSPTKIASMSTPDPILLQKKSFEILAEKLSRGNEKFWLATGAGQWARAFLWLIGDSFLGKQKNRLFQLIFEKNICKKN